MNNKKRKSFLLEEKKRREQKWASEGEKERKKRLSCAVLASIEKRYETAISSRSKESSAHNTHIFIFESEKGLPHLFDVVVAAIVPSLHPETVWQAVCEYVCPPVDVRFDFAANIAQN